MLLVGVGVSSTCSSPLPLCPASNPATTTRAGQFGECAPTQLQHTSVFGARVEGAVGLRLLVFCPDGVVLGRRVEGALRALHLIGGGQFGGVLPRGVCAGVAVKEGLDVLGGADGVELVRVGGAVRRVVVGHVGASEEGVGARVGGGLRVEAEQAAGGRAHVRNGALEAGERAERGRGRAQGDVQAGRARLHGGRAGAGGLEFSGVFIKGKQRSIEAAKVPGLAGSREFWGIFEICLTHFLWKEGKLGLEKSCVSARNSPRGEIAGKRRAKVGLFKRQTCQPEAHKGMILPPNIELKTVYSRGKVANWPRNGGRGVASPQLAPLHAASLT
ncbi:hypothetical protein HUJ04_000343 [Dendroctonus ponderosae]|nr:hypothetical protein HUJ04_000343 [Dendroctonus ponderosae]